MSNEFNGGVSETNEGVPESASYSEYHSTSEMHSAAETQSYFEFGKSEAVIPKKSTVVASKGMNEALKYSTQVATVIKAVAAVTVAAVVVMAPILEEGSNIQIEFLEYGADDSYVFYFIEIPEYNEGMNLSVSVHNDFVNRSKPIVSSIAEGYESGLQPNMEYKISVMDGSKTIAEKTVWTKKASAKPEFAMHYCNYNDSEEKFHLLFEADNDDWHGFNATVQWGEKSVGYADFTDTAGSQVVTVDTTGWNYTDQYEMTFHLWCKKTVDEKEEPVELYSNTFTTKRLAPVADVKECTYSAEDEEFTLSFQMSGGSYRGLVATVESWVGTIGSEEFSDDSGTKIVPIDTTEWNFDDDQEIKFNLWCKEIIGDKEELFEVYSQTFTTKRLAPAADVSSCTYSAADEEFTLSYEMIGGPYYDLTATVYCARAEIGSRGLADSEATASIPVDVSGWDNINEYTMEFRLRCKVMVAGVEQTIDVYSADFTSVRMPHMTVTGTPTFDRSAGTLTITYEYEDPNDVTYEDGIKAVVTCPALGTDTYQLAKPTDGSVTVNVSSFIGYDVDLEISYLHKDDPTLHSAVYVRDDIPLYNSDSTIGISGISLDDTDRKMLYLDMDYLDDDMVYSGISTDVLLNDKADPGDHPILDLGTNPHIALSNDIVSKTDVISITLHYSKHSPTDSTPVAQTDIVYSGSVDYVKPIFDGIEGLYRDSSDLVSFTMNLRDTDENWSNFALSAYYKAKGDDTEVPLPDVRITSDPRLSVNAEGFGPVPDYNAAIYLKMECDEEQRDGTTSKVTLFEDRVVSTVFITPAVLDSTSTYTIEFDIDEILGFDDPDTVELHSKIEWSDAYYTHYYPQDSTTEPDIQTIGIERIVITVPSATEVSGDGTCYLTITYLDGGVSKYLIKEAVIPGVHIPQG